jgi:chromosomal replication initiator protein
MDARSPAVSPRDPPDDGADVDGPAPSFDATLVGPFNQMACRAVRRFADGARDGFEALLLVGPSGCGKTHLLLALYADLLAVRRLPSVLFVPAERFHRQFLFALRRRLLAPFRDKYRTADVLLLDGLQGLATKPHTQGELLHTWDALLQSRRRAVVAADRPLSEIDGLSSPLRSRLDAAIAIRLAPPDLASRRAFLKARAAAWGFRCPEAALEEMAARIETGFRDLARCLEAFRDGGGDPRERLRRALEAPRRAAGGYATADEIARLVASAVGVRPEALRDRSRTRALVRGRQLCFYLGRRHTALTLDALGDAFGARDHATVHLAIRRLEAALPRDPLLAGLVRRLDRSLSERSAATP